jgi:15-cis-phytoene synthase
LIAIYALNAEIARTAEVVTQPAIGDIRLAWWREAIEEVAAGKPSRAHPVVEAFANAHRAAPQALDIWEHLIQARAKDLDAAPFANWSELASYIDATAGGVLRAALTACGVDPGALESFIRPAAQAWGCVGLLRAEPYWRAKGRALLPPAGDLDELTQRASAAIAETKSASHRLPSEAFPAVGYVALARRYLRAHERRTEPPPLLLRQLRLIAAAVTGRV